MINYGRQDVHQDDIDAVVAVLRSDFRTQGPAVPRFEEEMARRVGVDHAVAVSNATCLQRSSGSWYVTLEPLCGSFEVALEAEAGFPDVL